MTPIGRTISKFSFPNTMSNTLGQIFPLHKYIRNTTLVKFHENPLVCPWSSCFGLQNFHFGFLVFMWLLHVQCSHNHYMTQRKKKFDNIFEPFKQINIAWWEWSESYVGTKGLTLEIHLWTNSRVLALRFLWNCIFKIITCTLNTFTFQKLHIWTLSLHETPHFHFNSCLRVPSLVIVNAMYDALINIMSKLILNFDCQSFKSNLRLLR